MDRYHFDDLTKINVPFGLLDDDTQYELLTCYKTHNGIEFFRDGEWLPAKMLRDISGNENNGWEIRSHMAYRAKPAPLTKPHIPDAVWRVLPDWVTCAAQDIDGCVCALPSDVKPRSVSWYSSQYVYIGDLKGVTPGTCDWRDSLVKRPEGL